MPENNLSTGQHAQIEKFESAGHTVVILQENARPVGLIGLRDTLRADAIDALRELRTLNIQAVMLTGDNPRAASIIASELGIAYRASLLPADKVTAGIAMGSGSDVALVTANALRLLRKT